MPGEAVTLQLGRYAGCVGTHWWGMQVRGGGRGGGDPEAGPGRGGAGLSRCPGPLSPQAAALRGPAEAAELRPAALLRAGRAAGGRETHTPRLVALELKGTAGRGGRGSGRAAGAGAGRPRRDRPLLQAARAR